MVLNDTDNSVLILSGKQVYGFPDRNMMLEEDSLDQTVANLTARGSPQGERIERFSRKVFVGGLPPDIDEGKFKMHVHCFSILTIQILQIQTFICVINMYQHHLMYID